MINSNFNLNHSLKDRFSDPFYGTLTVSLIIWNWKIWIILLSEIPYLEKVNAISINLNHWNILWAILTTTAWTILIPAIELPISKAIFFMKRKKQEIQRREAEKFEEIKVSIERKDDEISNLLIKCNNLEKEINISQDGNRNLNEELEIQKVKNTNLEEKTSALLIHNRRLLKKTEDLTHSLQEIKDDYELKNENYKYIEAELRNINQLQNFIELIDILDHDKKTEIDNIDENIKPCLERSVSLRLVKMKNNKGSITYELTDLGLRFRKKLSSFEKKAS